MTATTDRLDTIEKVLNVSRFTNSRLALDDWQQAKAATPELPSGDRNVYDRMREIGISQDSLVTDVSELRAEVAALRLRLAQSPTVQPAPVVQAPATVPVPAVTNWPIGAYRLPIRPLTNGEQRNAIDALVRGGFMPQTVKIEADLAAGIYPVCDAGVIDPVKEIFWRDATPADDKAALKLFLSAIDQRNMTTNQLLPLSEAFPISGTLNASPTSSPTAQAAGSAQVVYTEAVAMVNPETGFTIWLGMSKNDDGLSVLYNYKYPWDNGAPSNPKLPQNLVRMERDGGFSVTGKSPAVDSYGNPVRLTEYDGLRGKDVVIYPNGFNRPDGEGKGKSVDIACMQAGRTLRLGASSATASPTFPLEITPNGVTVDGRPI